MRKLLLVTCAVLSLPLSMMAQETPRAELFGGYSYLRTEGGGGLHGWNASVAANLNKWFGLVVDFSGHYDSSSQTFSTTFPDGTVITGESDFKRNAHTFLIGPRFSYREHDRLTPFAHVLVGGTRQHIETDTIIRGPVEQRFDFSDSNTRFVGSLGGGLDVKLTESIALRVIQADYQWTRLSGVTQDNARVSTGIVFRFGK